MSGVIFGIFGLGEVGSLIAADPGASDATRAFDPADVGTPPGVRRCAQSAEAVAGADGTPS